MNPQKIVIFSGAGMSAPSGLATFRDNGGLWKQYRFEEVASPEAWAEHPEVVLEFYNERRAKAAVAEPNAGHKAIAALESHYEVVVVTQNVDDLHERAGSSQVIHLHGELRKARSSEDDEFIQDIGGAPIQLGDVCPKGGQMRPHIVWFGENIMNAAEAVAQIKAADKLVVVGTSLVVYPAAGFISYAPATAEKWIVDLNHSQPPAGFRAMTGSADVVMPELVQRWLA